MTPITAWAIKAPDGSYQIWTEYHGFKTICNHNEMPTQVALAAAEGYRCVRVTVQEMQE